MKPHPRSSTPHEFLPDDPPHIPADRVDGFADLLALPVHDDRRQLLIAYFRGWYVHGHVEDVDGQETTVDFDWSPAEDFAWLESPPAHQPPTPTALVIFYLTTPHLTGLLEAWASGDADAAAQAEDAWRARLPGSIRMTRAAIDALLADGAPRMTDVMADQLQLLMLAHRCLHGDAPAPLPMHRRTMPRIKRATSSRLVIAPQNASHANEMFEVLADPALHTHTGGTPPASPEALAERFAALEVSQSPDGRELWFNWVIRERATSCLAGFVQATVRDEVVRVAWVVGTAFQGRGFATEAANLMIGQLIDLRLTPFECCIAPANTASRRVAEKLGFAPTDRVEDGETVWRSGSIAPAPRDARHRD